MLRKFEENFGNRPYTGEKEKKKRKEKKRLGGSQDLLKRPPSSWLHKEGQPALTVDDNRKTTKEKFKFQRNSEPGIIQAQPSLILHVYKSNETLVGKFAGR